MIFNDLKAFILKYLANDPVILKDLIKVYFEDILGGTQVSFQFDYTFKSPYIIDIAFKTKDRYSVRVYLDDFFYFKRRSLLEGLISSLDQSIQDTVNRLTSYLDITGFTLEEDYYK